MINTVRATVLSIANKNNYGYITPSDFNLYAKQAQLDIFEDYFYQYNSWVVKQNARVSGSGYADILRGLVEVIDSFSETRGLTNTGINLFNLPEDYYLINKINLYPNIITSSTTTAAALNTLTDTNATFNNGSVLPGQIVYNSSLTSVSSGVSAYVISVDSATQLTLSANPFGTAATIGNGYVIATTAGIREIERVSQNKIFYLNSSHLTSPTTSYPAYVLGGATAGTFGNTLTVYPTTITISSGIVVSQYIRYPLDPNWTYSSLTGGEPVFDEGQADYQDFELPESDEPNIVNKILQYAGVSIREEQIVAFGQLQESEDNTQQN